MSFLQQEDFRELIFFLQVLKGNLMFYIETEYKFEEQKKVYNKTQRV